ncbi:phage tail protein [Pseudomonas oryzihabitans]|uniref:Uncharacterized protein n=1 Tax=Pseudomonas oryzihabitans TaxID=47885 RepID=A0A2Z5A834_9PSED|nr:phage tail protein [Pseudomonas oryzihabitans]AXA66757.1 hypothetical protein CE139_13320 [Pseudomonas oryzihabitans]
MSLSAQLFGRDSFIFKATNALGLGIPGWLDKKFGPKDTEGTRLEDLSVQTSTYGADIPRLYGTISMAGNILWLEGGKLKEVVKKNKKGGKGGASTTPTKTYTYFATFALGLCEGPIAGVRRIWCSDTLLYNADSDDLETIIASNSNAKGWRLYLGDDGQQPDARYEADVGPGNAPAFRGLAYLVFYDFDLTDYANTLQASQFKVEIVTSGSSATVLADLQSREPTEPISRLSVGAQYNDDLSSYYVCLDSSGSTNLVKTIDGKRVSREGIAIPSQSFIAPISSTLSTFKYACYVQPQSSGTQPSVAFGGEGDHRLLRLPDRVARSFAEGVTADEVFVFSNAMSGGFAIDKGVPHQKDLNGYVYEPSVSVVAPADCAICADSSHVYAFARSSEDGAPLTLYVYSAEDLALLKTLTFGLSEDGSVNSLDSGIAVSDGLIYLTFGQRLDGINFAIFDIGSESISESYANFQFSRLRTPGYICMRATGNAVAWGQPQLDSQANLVIGSALFKVANPEASQVPLEQVILQECILSGAITASDLLIEPHKDVVGYKVASGSIRSALEPLQSAYPFDVIQSGYKIRFVKRGKSSSVSIPLDQLYAGEDGSDDALSQSREMESQLPNRIVIKYLDASREYDVSQQQYQRASTSSVGESSLDLSLVLTADKAAQIAEVLCYLAWLERVEFSFILPPLYSGLEPSDIVTLYDETVSYELRITETTQGIEGRTECRAVPNRASLYSSQAVGGVGSASPGTISLPGKSVAVLLDIPVVDETIQNDPGIVAAVTGYTSGWSGAVLIGSSDNGQTYSDLQGFAGKGTLGTAAGALTANGGTLIDMSSLGVSLISGQLESVTRDKMLSGVNYAAYGIGGRWEIVRFQNAVLQPDGSYVVSGFLRGQRGTEWATGLHKESDWFVLLDDSDNAFIDLPASSLAESRLYKAVTSRQSADDAAAQDFTYKGVNLQPLSPVYARGSRNGGSLTVTWTRRSRLSNSWWTTGVAAPLGEDTESYQVEVMAGSTVVRTIASSNAAITYTAAQQQTDFGSVQSAVTLRIFQLSAAVGRGRALEVTL